MMTVSHAYAASYVGNPLRAYAGVSKIDAVVSGCGVVVLPNA
jgi:hypothetical protein